MLTLIESKQEKVETHKRLEAELKRSWSQREKRWIVWRPERREMTIFHDGRCWFASDELSSGHTTPRFWDPFGAYEKDGDLRIGVEINVPTDSNGRQIAGFYAKDRQSGVVYLMHDGGLGGGRKGVGKSAFLAWSDSELVPVVDAQGDVRPGIVVAPVGARNTSEDIARFVRKAIEFKEAVRNGETATPQARAAQRRYSDYFDEFSGKKRRGRIEEIEYISRHGDIVRALRDWRLSTIKTTEHVFKDAYVDLGVRIKNTTREIYEVKTRCDRQSLYAAIGQVVVHDDSPNGDCIRFLVLPENEILPDDIKRALGRSGIALVRFMLTGDKVRIVEP